MKINYAIMGSNLNPDYFNFWPIISKTWKEVFNITPVLGLICDENSDFLQDEFGIIKKFKSIDGIDSGLQSQIVRHWLSKEVTGNIIITDIDMLPMSKNYFINQFENLDENKFYIMSSDNEECNRNSETPMCYNVSNSKLYSEILDLDNNWEDFVVKLNSFGFGWTTDQRYLWIKIQEQISKNPDSIVKFDRGWPQNRADKRIDRIKWVYDSNLIKEDYYIDSHLLRPYTTHKEEIDKLARLLY